jgi:hypothetical protein
MHTCTSNHPLHVHARTHARTHTCARARMHVCSRMHARNAHTLAHSRIHAHARTYALKCARTFADRAHSRARTHARIYTTRAAARAAAATATGHYQCDTGKPSRCYSGGQESVPVSGFSPASRWPASGVHVRVRRRFPCPAPGASDQSVHTRLLIPDQGLGVPREFYHCYTNPVCVRYQCDAASSL